MAEEAGGETPSAPAAAEVAPVQATEGTGDQANISSMFNALRGLSAGEAVTEQIQGIRKAESDKQQPAPVAAPPVQQAEAVQQGQTETTPPAQNQNTPATAEPSVETEAPAASDPVVINNPIYGQDGLTIGEEAAAPEPLKFENLNEIGEYMKSTYGVEDFEGLTSQWNEMKVSSDKLPDTQAQLDNALNIFKSMPAELYAGVQAHIQGQDWKKVVGQTPVFDYSKTAEEQEEKTLVNAYFPNQLSEEQWEEALSEDADPAAKSAKDALVVAAKSKYSVDHNQIALQQKEIIDNATRTQQEFEVSVTGTISKLSGQFEGIDSNYVTNIENQLKGKGIYDAFFKQDGTLREDAAQRYVMATDGVSLLASYKQAAENRSMSAARQEVLLETPTTPPLSGGQSETTGPEVRPEVQKMIDDMKGLNGSKTY